MRKKWTKRIFIVRLLLVPILAASLPPLAAATPEEEKDALVSEEARNYGGGVDAGPGDPSRFEFPCEPLPVVRTPHDGNDANDGGWRLVDFCTAGSTGADPAEAPDCHHNDDDSALLALPFTFDLYGDSYTDVYVNNNGNLSFGQLFSTFTPSGFPLSGFPMVAPFWADVDTGDPGNHLGHIWYKLLDGDKALAVTWENVGHYNERGDKLNTFQVVITDGSDARLTDGNNVAFCYDDMQWTTGDASGGVGGFGGTPATVGANNGNGVDFFELGRFNTAEGVDTLDGLGAGAGSPILFNASGENVPPVAKNFPVGDEVTTECNQVLDLTLEFSSPEGDQTTTVTVDDPDGAQAAGLAITNTPGQTATIDLDWAAEPADQGTYVLTFTATDDFVPPGETTRSLTINVECLESTPLPSVSEDLTGVAANSRTGSSVAGAGDLDDDGLNEVLAGAPGYEGGPLGAPVEAGAAVVYLGSTSEAERAEADIIFVGEAAHDRVGVAVAGNFYFDGDLVPDLLIGASQVDRTDPDPANHVATGPGRVYLVYFDPADYPNIGDPTQQDVVSLSRVACTSRGTCGAEPEIDGVVFEGASLGDLAGFALAGGGFVSAAADPFGEPPLSDIAIGAPGRDVYPATDAGTAYLVFSDPTLSGTVSLGQVACTVSSSCGADPEVEGIVYEGAAAGDLLGFSVDFPGDVVEPAGGDDFAMGAPKVDVPAPGPLDDVQADAGTGYFASGGNLGKDIVEVCDIGSPAPSATAGEVIVAGAQIRGDQAGMQLGYSVAGGGDNITNGQTDLLIGAPYYDVGDLLLDAEAAADAGLTAQTAGTLRQDIIEVCDIGTTAGDTGTVEGTRWLGAEAGDQLGIAVAGVGDVTGDGTEDIAMGAPFSDPDGITNAGTVYVVEGTGGGGGDAGVARRDIIEVCDIGGSEAGRALTGTQPDQEAGTSVSATGDTGGDGENDLAVGSPGDDAGTGSVSLVDEGSEVANTAPPTAPSANASATASPVECDGGLEGPALLDGTLSDDVNDDILLFEWFDAVGTLIGTSVRSSVRLDLGTQQVTLEVEDSAGLVDSDTVFVTVRDTNAPVPTCPQNATEECDGTRDAQVDLPLASADDLCDNGEVVTNDATGGGADASGVYPLGDTVVTFTATDNADNSTTCQTTVSVVDTAGPVPSCPAPASEECTGDLQAAVTLAPATADDTCDNGVAIANSHNAGGADASGSYPLGDTVVTFTATDDATNAADCQTTVSVVDTAPPEVLITSPADGACFGPGASVDVTESLSDACDADVSKSYGCQGPCGASQPPPYSSHGDHVVTVRAEDTSLNEGSASVGFTIDGVAPTVTITSPPDTATLPVDLPLDVTFDANDDDDASGGIDYELISLSGCVIYDGRSFGDNDGIFEGLPDDPDVTLDEAELCRIADDCGFTSLVEPELRVEAFDVCGGNMGFDAITLGGSVALTPGLCASIPIQVSSGTDTTVDWEGQGGAVHYDVIRGDVANLRVDGGQVDLGPVVCVESSSLDTTTAGNEDEEIPESGQFFFFLVQSYDGQVESSWGRDSAGRDRVVQEGNGGCN